MSAGPARGIRFLDLEIDVSEAAGLGERLRVRATLALPPPQALPQRSVICFAQPGAGYSRGYYSFDMPGAAHGGQAGWHAERGWIFCAIDPLGVGESSLPDPARLMFAPVCAASHAAVRAVLERLAAGELADGFPPLADPVVIGLGHSMGGALTVVQQAHHDTYDAIAVLGFSAVQTRSSVLPGSAPPPIPELARGTLLPGPDPLSLEVRSEAAVNARLIELRRRAGRYPNEAPTPPGWSYHFDDVQREIVERDLDVSGEPPPWRSLTMPGLVHWVTAAGAIAPEAACIVVPVLAAFGERDVLDDPRLEAKAYRHAADFSLFICPRMGHMHNFASTREILWSRIHHWGEHVADLKARLPQDWPAQLFSDSYP
jgi:alpha-beta hydrolase superfamily lysophospholipase